MYCVHVTYVSYLPGNLQVLYMYRTVKQARLPPDCNTFVLYRRLHEEVASTVNVMQFYGLMTYPSTIELYIDGETLARRVY